MARGRPQGRSKSDHRVCQAARHARAAESRERISISAEQQEARIAAVNAECNVEDSPRRRRGQKTRHPETKSGAARVSVWSRSFKASGSAKKKANKPLEHALCKAAGRDPHILYCHECGATGESGLRGGKKGGEVIYFCRGHTPMTGCFRINNDHRDWAEEQEMRFLRAEERRLEEELRNLGGASFAAEPAAASNGSHSAGYCSSMPMSQSLIATLLIIGGIESHPGPSPTEVAQVRGSWLEAYRNGDPKLLDYLAQQKVILAEWRALPAEARSESLTELKADYQGHGQGQWAVGWNVFLRRVAASSGVEMHDADQVQESWPEAYKDVDPMLLDYLAQQKVRLADWRALPAEARSESLTELKADYQGHGQGRWTMGWNVFLRGIAGAGPSALGECSSGQLSDNRPSCPDVSIVNWLVTEYGDMLKKSHLRDPLGALRDGGFDPDGTIQDHLRLQGREEAFECWITLTANIVSSWKRRNPNLDQRDYRRHVVHLLLLSCPGSGKTTFLTYSLRWLREWLKKPDAFLEGWLGGTMFGEGNLSDENTKLVQEMLGALRIAAGSSGYHTFGILRVEEEGVSTTEAESADGFTAKNAPALRLLYAMLCPLDSTPSEKPPGGYYSFLRRFSERAPDIKNRILIQDVVAFVREGLEVPEGKLFLLPLLIDEGNVAKGVFLNEFPPQTGDNPTWLKWFLSKITLANNDDTSNLNLIVPMTATTRWDSTSLQWTASGHAQATYIPLKPLSLIERKDLICDLATRVAAHNRRPAVKHKDLPDALRNDGLDIVGGNPRLMSWLLEGIGGRYWAKDFDEAVKAITPSNLVNIVKKVKQTAYEQLKLKRIIDLTASPEEKKSCLQVVVATMMLDLLVKRKQKLKAPSSGLDLPITWGELEGDGVVELIPLLGVGASQPSKTASKGPSPSDLNPGQTLPKDLPSATRALPAPLSTPPGQPSSPQPLTPSAALPARPAPTFLVPRSPTPHQPSEAADSAAPFATPLPGPSARSGSSSGASLPSEASPPFNRMGKGGRGEVVVRDEDWGVLVESESGEKTSPTKLGMLNRETACPQPTSEPGDEWVKVTMGFFMFTLLLERMELIRESDLSTFSDAMVRESPLDKEKADVMAVALKLQALHLIGQTEFSLKDAFPNSRIPSDLADRRFLVPPGPLTVGDGLPMGHKLSEQQFASTVADIASKIQERVRTGKWGKDALNIGLVGPGNDGWDGFVVLLEAKRDPKRDPWVLFCQTKQESSPKQSYVTLKEILRNLETDVRQTPYSPPTLPAEWVQWQREEAEETESGAHLPAAGGGEQGTRGAKLREAGEAVEAGRTRAGKRPRPDEAQERAPGARKQTSKERELAEAEETLLCGGEQAGKRRTASKVPGPGGKREELKGRKRKEQEEPGKEELGLAHKKQKSKDCELSKADTLPNQHFNSNWTCNMIYSYVSDRRFSRRQLDLLKDVERKGHPWLQRLLIVSREDQDSWYSRIGALRRSATLHWLSEKMVLQNA